MNRTQAEQPHWVTPLVTVTPRLEQEFRTDRACVYSTHAVLRDTCRPFLRDCGGMGAEKLLFLNDSLDQIARAVDVDAAQDGGKVRQQLQRNDFKNRQ